MEAACKEVLGRAGGAGFPKIFGDIHGEPQVRGENLMTKMIQR